VNDKRRTQSYRETVAGIQARLRKYVPEGVSLAEELIAERRAEAGAIQTPEN
jgi:hypothetical protein